MSSHLDLKKRLIAQIDSNIDQIAQLCGKIIAIPSENPPGDTIPLFEMLKDLLEAKGIDVTVYEPKKGCPNLVATLKGNSNHPNLILNGHMDVFPGEVGEKWHYPPFCGTVKEGKVLGRGAGDMKGGLTALFVAFMMISESNVELPGRVTLTLVSDEETGGIWGTRWLVENVPDVRGDGCLNGEPSGLEVRIGEKGKMSMKVKAAGRSGHASMAPYIGDNAIMKMLRAMPLFYELTEVGAQPTQQERNLIEGLRESFKSTHSYANDVLDRVSVSVGTILGGTKVNIIPAFCEAEVDIRVPVGVRPQEVKRILEENLSMAGVDITCDFLDAVTRANYTLPDEDLVRIIRQNGREISGVEPPISYFSGRTDCCYFRELGIPAVVYGPTGYNVAAANEYITIKDLITVSKVHTSSIIDFIYQDLV